MRVLAPLAAALLAVTALVGLWWLETLRDQSATTATTGTANEDALASYFEAFTMRDYSSTREMTHILRGERLSQFARDDTAEIEQPRLSYRPANAPPWRGRAARGELGPDGQRIELRDNVVLVRHGASRPRLRLETHSLTIFRSAGRAETSAPVRARSPGWVTTAVGMEAYFDRGRVELASDVWSRYEPEGVGGG